jgi:hypothetical protein
MNDESGFGRRLLERVRDDWQASGESVKESLLRPGMWLLVVLALIVFTTAAVAALVT